MFDITTSAVVGSFLPAVRDFGVIVVLFAKERNEEVVMATPGTRNVTNEKKTKKK